MQIHTYVFFKGQCEEAFRFYEQNLGAKVEAMVPYADSPMVDDISPAWRSKIMHARLNLGDQVLMGSDPPPERYQKPQGFFVSLDVDPPSEAERIFHVLAKDGQVVMPIQRTFWAERFGMAIDRFDIPWMVNCSGQGRGR